MASSLFALIDDIAAVLDDVALLTKVAAKKTAGVLGDDLALNAQQVSGAAAERELPIVWAVFVGSLRNKLVLVPSALVISVLAPWAITPLLMVGGAYLCFEGFEKLAQAVLHSKAEREAHAAKLLQAMQDPGVDLLALEKDKIAGAIRTDFVLSAEIIAITLGTVQASHWSTQLAVLSGVALLMTVGVYGLVAGIVKIDDAGLYLSRKPADATGGGMQRALGRLLLSAAPLLMKALNVLGTAAMFLVGGGILVHGLGPLHHAIEAVTQGMSAVRLQATGLLLEAATGVLAGALVLLVVKLCEPLWSKLSELKVRRAKAHKD